MENVRTQMEFPSPVIQAQSVGKLVAAVLKEKGPSGKITKATSQGSALEALWQQCCSDGALVRSTCCDAVVLLVDQGHADLHHVLNSVLNMVPSARNVQGLIGVVGRLLQMQVEHRNQDQDFTCPYSIRSSPHPFITALENRSDCWPALLTEIHDFLRRAEQRCDPAHVAMLAPFLRFLYCCPQRSSQQALLRHALLRVLLPPLDLDKDQKKHLDLEKDQNQDGSSLVWDSMLLLLCQLVPHIQVDSVEAVLELHAFAEALVCRLLTASERHRGDQGAKLLLQLLTCCQRCLSLGGDCRPLLGTMERLLHTLTQKLPVDELLIGMALLLMDDAPPAQQTCLLELTLAMLGLEPGPPPWLAPVLVLPALQLLACSGLSEAVTDPHTHRRNGELARNLLDAAGHTPKPPLPSSPCPRPLSSWHSQLAATLASLHWVASSPAAAADWLLSLGSALSTPQHLPPCVTLLVTHLLLTGDDDVCRLALHAITAIAAADPGQVPALLPLLLFKLGKEKDPNLVHAMVNVMPGLATHKLCVPLVLQTIKSLSSGSRMKAVVLRLLTKLWSKQDRVYPELQRLLAQTDGRGAIGRDAQWEQTLARAACLRDICRERPFQHGGDMLAAIVVTLKQCSQPDLAPPATLALQGLQELVQAEVVDVVSLWRTLGPQLKCDSRPLVVKAVADLLALVPQVPVRTEEFQKLQDEAVSFLWSLAVSQDPQVSSWGFKALAPFPDSTHKVTLLPEAARPLDKHPRLEEEESAEEEAQGVDEEQEEEDLSIPGSSYVKLLTLSSSSVLPALQVFLQSLVQQEASVMPRGVFFQALRGASLRSDRGKTVAGIPSFMLRSYEKNKQPGLKPGLAAGLLLSYDLPQQSDREGRPIDRFLLSRSRSFQQTLTALIHEVNIQPSEWHRALLLPRAWGGFMSRAFHAVLQGRRADLEMQQKQGKGNPEKLQYQQHCSWLWARDQLTDVIKCATKDSPVVQGNSILALSGLAAALAKYESNQPADGEGSLGAGPEFVPTSSWLSMVMDTLLGIVSSSYRAKGQVFPCFPHRSYSGENTASAIARSCASLALALLVPVLASWQQDGPAQVLSALRAGLPGSPGAEDSQAVQFHSGLGLGLVLCGLQQQRLSDTSAELDADLLGCILHLERCSFDPDLEYNTGCILGLGLSLASLSVSGETEHRNLVTRILEQMLRSLQDSSGRGRMLQEVLAYSVACISVSAFRGGLVDSNWAQEVMDALRTLTEESQQTQGFSLALGLAVHGFSTSGHGKADDLHPRLLAAWLKILLAEGCPTMQRLAAVNGLVALVGSESYLIQQPKNEQELSAQQQNRLNEVIRAISQIITFSGAIGLQSNSACLLGHLHLAQVSCSHTHTAVPPDFSYLPERSVIRALVDFLTEAARKGPEWAPPAAVRAALTPLASVGASFQFPPINWGAVLSPLMRLSFGEEVQHQCVVLAASQVQSSQSASTFLGSWIAPPLVHSLSVETRTHLHRVLASWLRNVAEDKLQAFLENPALRTFEADPGARRLALSDALLGGVAAALKLPDPPAPRWRLLCSTAQELYGLLPPHVQDGQEQLYLGVSECLSEMSDTEIDRIATVTEVQMEKSCVILALLVSRGRLPLLALNDVVAGAIRGWPSRRIGWLLLHTFYQSRMAGGANTGVSKRKEWLLELMGLIRNVAYGGAAITCTDPRQATHFLFRVFAGAVVAWGDHAMPLLLGVRSRWFPWQPDPRPPALGHGLYGDEATAEDVLDRSLLGLSHSLPLLLDKEPWRTHTPKFIEWLLSISEGPDQNLTSSTIDTARAALQALSFSADFRKKAVWTRAYGW